MTAQTKKMLTGFAAAAAAAAAGVVVVGGAVVAVAVAVAVYLLLVAADTVRHAAARTAQTRHPVQPAPAMACAQTPHRAAAAARALLHAARRMSGTWAWQQTLQSPAVHRGGDGGAAAAPASR